MSTYTKVEKETATYAKVDEIDDRGWFTVGWFSPKDWFLSGIYTKINKEIATYTKIDKE